MRARRFALTLVYYLQGIALAWRMAPAIVHANDYNTMWIGVAAKQLRRSWLVYDCHELWPDRNGRPEWRAWLIACETLFVRIADATLTTSPGYAREIARRYRVPAPVLVRNAQARSEPARGPREGSDEGPVAVYVGGLMPGRGLEVAISAAARVPRLRLRLIGPGNERYLERLRERARKADVADRVELLPPVAPTHVVDAIGYADVGLMLIEPVCRSYELTLPNKLFEYAAAGLPILASDLPVIGQVVRDDGLGEVVAPNDVELIALAMERLIDPEIAREVRERVRSFASRATWDRERATLERVYNEAGR
jgi:glycosyltransferase involved in cell wall biosynthesis